jgi:hypothetical protein
MATVEVPFTNTTLACRSAMSMSPFHPIQLFTPVTVTAAANVGSRAAV